MHVNRRTFVRRVAAAGAGLACGTSGIATAQAGDTYVFFALNIQDFAYPDLSAQVLDRAITLHESLGLPVDVLLTTWMVDLLQGVPALARRLATSPVVSLGYHTRAPLPYRANYDWYGLSRLPEAQQYELIHHYETHRLDKRTGLPAWEPGGYQHYTSLLGRPPRTVGNAADAGVQSAADAVFRALGARVVVANDRTANLGEMRNGLLQRPEHVDVKLFSHLGQDARQVVDQAIAAARTTAGARAPYFVGIKMHDNDFFAEDSAWLTVYQRGRRSPPWDPTLKSPLLDGSTQAAMWSLYETAVRYVADLGVPVVNADGVLQLSARLLHTPR